MNPLTLLSLGLSLVDTAEADTPPADPKPTEIYGLTAQTDIRKAVEILYRGANEQARKDCPDVPQLQLVVVKSKKGDPVPVPLEPMKTPEQLKPLVQTLTDPGFTHYLINLVTLIGSPTPIMNGFSIGDSQTTPAGLCFVQSAASMNRSLEPLRAKGLDCEVYGEDFQWAAQNGVRTTPVTGFIHLVGADCMERR